MQHSGPDRQGSLLGSGGEAEARLVSAPQDHCDDHAPEQLAVLRTPHRGEPSPIPRAWDHPHLVKVLEPAGRTRGELLEYVPGGSVAGLVAARGGLPVGEAVTLLVPVARALSHLHAHGAVHGDVSPQNILFDASGSPVLVDPGLARALGEAGPSGGTAGFSAPEAEHGPAADVHGWGALAWFVLTGEAPAPERRRVPLPLLRSDVVAGASRLIEDCLARDPHLRPPAEEIGPDLLSWHRPQPLHATAAAHGDGMAHLSTRHTPRSSGRARTRGSFRRAHQALTDFLGFERRPEPLPGSPAGSRPGRTRTITALAFLAAVGAAAAIVVVSRPANRNADVGPILAATGTSSGTHGVGPSPAPPAPGADEAVAALPELDRKRTAALAGRDAAALKQIHVPGAALDADRSTIRTLRERGSHFVGLDSRLEDLTLVKAEDADEVQVAARSVTSGEEVPLSATATSGAGATARTEQVRFSLIRTEDGWRIADITAAPPDTAPPPDTARAPTG